MKINRGIYEYTRNGRSFVIERFCDARLWDLFEEFPGTRKQREWVNDFCTKRDAVAHILTMEKDRGHD